MADIQTAVVCGAVFLQGHIDALNRTLDFLHSIDAAGFDAHSSNVTLRDGTVLKKSAIWRKVCDSYLVHDSAAMLQLIKVLISGADEYRYYSGSIRITYRNIAVCIPTVLSDTVAHRTIEFYYNHLYMLSYPTIPEPCDQEIFARRYAAALRSKAPLHILLKLRAPTLHPVRRYFMYVTRWYWKDRKDNRDAAYYEAVVKKYERYRSDDYKKELARYVQCMDERADYESNFLPVIMSFADGYFEVDRTFFASGAT